MSPKQSHQWLLIIVPSAQEVFDTLPSSTQRGIFRQLRQLLLADAPYSAAFVEMLEDKQFARIRKFRVGDYRIFFQLEAKPVTHQDHLYKGKLFLLDILDRKDAY